MRRSAWHWSLQCILLINIFHHLCVVHKKKIYFNWWENKKKCMGTNHAGQFIEHFFYTNIVLSRSLKMPCTNAFRVTAKYLFNIEIKYLCFNYLSAASRETFMFSFKSILFPTIVSTISLPSMRFNSFTQFFT